MRGGKSIAKAAEILADETGRVWTAKVLDRMLRREVYKLAQPGRIVDPRVWGDAQRAMASRRKVKSA